MVSVWWQAVGKPISATRLGTQSHPLSSRVSHQPYMQFDNHLKRSPTVGTDVVADAAHCERTGAYASPLQTARDR